MLGAFNICCIQRNDTFSHLLYFSHFNQIYITIQDLLKHIIGIYKKCINIWMIYIMEIYICTSRYYSDFVIPRKILLVCRVYSHHRRCTPLHSKQQSTTTSVRKFAAASILLHAHKCRPMRASWRGYPPRRAELSQKVNKAFSQT